MEKVFYMDVKHWNKVIDYARAANKLYDTEIGGMLVALQDKEGDWELMDPTILKQDVTAASTVLDKDELAEYYNSIAMNKKYGPKTQFVWWHSHNNMKAYWSGTDTNTMLEYKGGKFSMSLVVNTKEEYKFRVCVWDPIEAHEDIELDIIGRERSVSKSILKEVEAKCTKPTANITTYKGGKKIVYTQHYSGYKSPDQLELAQWNGSFNADHREAVDTDTYNALFEAMDDYNSEYVSGTILYGEWLKKVKLINAQLKQRTSIYSVREMSKEELDTKVLYAHPYEFIKGHPYDHEGYYL